MVDTFNIPKGTIVEVKILEKGIINTGKDYDPISFMQDNKKTSGTFTAEIKYYDTDEIEGGDLFAAIFDINLKSEDEKITQEWISKITASKDKKLKLCIHAEVPSLGDKVVYCGDNMDLGEGIPKDRVWLDQPNKWFEVNVGGVGIRLNTNIEKLPSSPSNYNAPPTFSEPNKSFEVANLYQNCMGMCFAVTMARVDRAYQDEHNISVLTVKSSGQDYTYSGTISNNISDECLGYGVGGALAAKGYADLIPHEDVWNGKLREGALIQYWGNPNSVDWNTLKKAIKNSLSGVQDDNFHGGHSVIFKSYIYGSNKVIIGIKYYDYHGIVTNGFKPNDMKILMGANLRDEKK